MLLGHTIVNNNTSMHSSTPPAYT